MVLVKNKVFTKLGLKNVGFWSENKIWTIFNKILSKIHILS